MIAPHHYTLVILSAMQSSYLSVMGLETLLGYVWRL